MKKILSLILLIMTAGILVIAAENKPGFTLKETFDLFVQSIQHSDLKGLLSIISSNKEFAYLTSTGKLLNTRDEYIKFHEQWFNEAAWQWLVDSIEIHEEKDSGYITAIYHYKSKTPEGVAFYLDSYFTLIFHRESEMWKAVAEISTPFNRSVSAGNDEQKYTTDQVYLLDVMKTRRTVRKYQPTPVPREHIMKILDAARMAPTSGNQQPWKFLVIENKQKIAKLKEEAFKWYFENSEKVSNPDPKKLVTAKETIQNALTNALSAPVYVAVLVDSNTKYPEYILQDGVLAAGYLMIAAKALGYGTAFFTSFFPEAHMKEFFKIPDDYKLICFTPIGVPEGVVHTPRKKPLKDMVVFESF